jgi:lipoprotein-releasing system permease protein/zinc transport system substrate-binding protein
VNLSLYIARRYLFSKKSHNAINILSLIAVCGVTLATTAMVCTLSVLNGFRGFVSEKFSAFDPELKITAVKGKVFDPTAAPFLHVRALPAIDRITETLEDNVLVRYRERQTPAILKGVSDNFDRPIPLWDGEFQLHGETGARVNMGIGVAGTLGVHSGFIAPLEIYAPKRQAATINLAQPMAAFHREYAYISSIFMVEQAVYDDQYLIVPLDLARTLFDYPTEVGAWEVQLKDAADLSAVRKQIQGLLGDAFQVKDRYEQQETAFRMIQIEKWFIFLMLCFISLIAAFNIIGSLSMLMVDKQPDIRTLRNLGAGQRLISQIFLFEGWLISAVGAATGLLLGLLLCLGQQHFGWIKLGSSGAFAVEAYPVQVQPGDLGLIGIAVLVIGFLAVLYPVRYLSRQREGGG